MLIEFIGYNEKPIFIEKNKIAGIGASNLGNLFTTIFICAGETIEEWKVKECLNDVRSKINNMV